MDKIADNFYLKKIRFFIAPTCHVPSLHRNRDNLCTLFDSKNCLSVPVCHPFQLAIWVNILSKRNTFSISLGVDGIKVTFFPLMFIKKIPRASNSTKLKNRELKPFKRLVDLRVQKSEQLLQTCARINILMGNHVLSLLTLPTTPFPWCGN